MHNADRKEQQKEALIMPDAMVTARMPLEKKEEGNRILEKLGTNPSQAVNKLYDYIVTKQKLPFPEPHKDHHYTKEEIERARAFVDSLSVLPKDNRFANLSQKEIKRERLKSRGLIKD